MIYDDCKVSMFWNKCHERQSVYIIFPDGKKKIKFYSRYLMEVHLDRFLEKNDIVHHIDGDPLNDVVENLQLTRRGEHEKLHYFKEEDFTCTNCGKIFTLKDKKLSSFKRRFNTGKVAHGAFCSHRCIAVYSQRNNVIIEETFKCPTCLDLFTLTGKKYESYRVNKKNRPTMKGPYCSRLCFDLRG